jgi:hypothetical protein
MQEYNRGVRNFFPKIALIGAALVLGACSKDIQNNDAVKAGVIEYLSSNQSRIGLDPNAMQIDVTSVSFQKDEARATVAFRPKAGDAGGGPMMINYVLDRKANKWVVRGRTESGASPHGAGGMPPAMPPGMPSGTPSETPQMPPGHPATGTPAPSEGKPLPPGHPSIGTKQ